MVEMKVAFSKVWPPIRRAAGGRSCGGGEGRKRDESLAHYEMLDVRRGGKGHVILVL
jgi:hypothetical protein